MASSLSDLIQALTTALPWMAAVVVPVVIFLRMSRTQDKLVDVLGEALGRHLTAPAAGTVPAVSSLPSLPPALVPPVDAKPVPAGPPPWFAWAQHEIGFHETGNNQGIGKYISLAHCGAEGDPWCAIFANAALEASGVPGTRSASSQSFRTHPGFTQLQTPCLGALAVFWRGAPDSGLGHVGFYAGEDATHVSVLGGNENDAVRIEDLPKSSSSMGLIGYWWPKSVPLPTGGPVTMPAKPPQTEPQKLTSAPAHQTGITATMFGGQKSAYGGAIDDNSPGVALPFHFTGVRPRVLVTSKAGSVECAIVDVGPWNTNDPYWTTGTRPQSETGTDMTGRKTNKAGIDLTLAAAKALQVDGKGLCDWQFIEAPQNIPPVVT